MTMPDRVKIVLIVILCIVLGIEVSALIDRYNHAGHLKELSQMVRSDLGLTDDMAAQKKALLIRNHIYQSVPLERAPKDYNFYDFAEAYRASTSGEIGFICGGLSLIYIAALESQGIPARRVGMWATEYDGGHASVEFWNGQKWLASDPTFNIFFRYEDEYLSYSEIWDLVRAGGAGKIEFVGEQKRDRLIQNYQIPFEAYNQMVVHPARVESQEWPMEIYPAGWQGAHDFAPYAGIWPILGKGLLR